MHFHDRLHRRQGRAAFPDPKAIAEAIADAFPNPFAEPKAAPQREAVSIVYVTASPTFDGPVGGYKTLTAGAEDEDEQPKTTRPARKTTTTTEEAETTRRPDPKQTSILVETSAPPTTRKQTTLQTSSSLPSIIASPTAALTSSAPILAATGSASKANTFTKTTPVSNAAATESSQPVKAEGMSAGGKAGLAIGILLLIGAVLALVLFVFKRKKDKKKQQEADNEKAALNFAAAKRAEQPPTEKSAPRLSLRPVTQFLPNLGGNEKRASRGNALNAVAAAPQPQRQQTPPEQNRNNPFGDHAGTIDSANADGPSPVQLNGPSGEILVAAAPTGTNGGLARGASKRGVKQDFTTKGGFMGPPSPSGTEFSQSSEATGTPTPTGTGAAIAAAGGPANTAVHRVQLDFKPSMEDELELRAGQLIRLLHEYDDGWALCIRLDRSQQGVVPRTCLSTRPVKPRPQQGPGPQGQRGPAPGQRGPQGPPGQMRPMSPGMNGPRGNPNQGRPASPGGRNSPTQQYGQRPMTPQGQQQRPMTPQGQGRPRSPSVAQQQGRKPNTNGPSPMNQVQPQQQLSSSPPNSGAPVGRKPVPGQAL